MSESVIPRDRRRINSRSHVRIRNRHAEVHRLAAGDQPVHRIEIEQIADHDLRAEPVPERLHFISTTTMIKTVKPRKMSTDLIRGGSRDVTTARFYHDGVDRWTMCQTPLPDEHSHLK